ncbi:MAG: glycosyltransferase family 39 protein, partial [Lutibacter sp.]
MNRQTKLIILVFCIINLTLYLVADSHSGFQGDELLYIEAGKHFAFGYMEFPPLIGLLAFFQNLFHNHSIFIYHIFPHLASILILILSAKITIELGGQNKAVFLVLLGIIIAPGFGGSQQVFQPVVFSQLFWMLSFYYLVRFLKFLDRKSLWLLTFSCILGFLSKYDAIFFFFGLTSLLFFTRTRNALVRNKFWLNILVVLICISPNLIWQILNDYPALQMFNRLYETQLDKINRITNIKELFISINPIVTLLLFLPGIYYMTSSKNKSLIFPLASSIVLSFFFLLYKNGKAYYFYPIALTILPFGAVFLEQIILKRKRWTIYPITILMLTGSLLIPFGMSVYSFNRYLTKIYPFEKKEIDGGKFAVRNSGYYSKQKWQTTMLQLKSVYDSLPVDERESCLIWGKHYGQAGAVNLFRNQYSLPPAFSYHGSFYSWTPSGQMPKTIIALSYRVGNFFQPYFGNITKVRTIYNPYSDNDEELYQYIYICKEPKQSFGK